MADPKPQLDWARGWMSETKTHYINGKWWGGANGKTFILVDGMLCFDYRGYSFGGSITGQHLRSNIRRQAEKSNRDDCEVEK